MKRPRRARPRWTETFALCAALAATSVGAAQIDHDEKLADATAVLEAMTAGESNAIPAELLQRARAIAIVPNVIRGGLVFVGARRGRGVLIMRSEHGGWSNPAFITVTGGSAGLQIGAESTDVILIFANDNAVKNMRNGKFTLSGEATAVAGPLGRQATSALTFRAEVYGYVRSRGLFAGAAFEGAKLAIDYDTNEVFYRDSPGARALEPQTGTAPASAQRFLEVVEPITAGLYAPQRAREAPVEEAVTFPLE
jgi:lipid-binding SYLF domain-containing protein